MRDTDDFNALWNADSSIALDYSTDHVATWKVFNTFCYKFYMNMHLYVQIKFKFLFLTKQEMEAQVRAKRARNIGLSNFNKTQILNILNVAAIVPSNLQVRVLNIFVCFQKIKTQKVSPFTAVLQFLQYYFIKISISLGEACS